jgi:AraC-like DNA-binding protein
VAARGRAKRGIRANQVEAAGSAGQGRAPSLREWKVEVQELHETLRLWDDAIERSPRLARARELVELRFPEPVPVPEVAAVAALERNSFSRYFTQRVGVTFSQWQRARRVAHALELLRAPEGTIEAVAHLAGFGTARSTGQGQTMGCNSNSQFGTSKRLLVLGALSLLITAPIVGRAQVRGPALPMSPSRTSTYDLHADLSAFEKEIEAVATSRSKASDIVTAWSILVPPSHTWSSPSLPCDLAAVVLFQTDASRSEFTILPRVAPCDRVDLGRIRPSRSVDMSFTITTSSGAPIAGAQLNFEDTPSPVM